MLTLLIAVGALALAVIGNAIIEPSTRLTPSQRGSGQRWQLWEPIPGMAKRQCPECRYFFASPPDAEELRCPDRVTSGTRPASADPP